MSNQILIVDDSQTQRLTLKFKLEKHGYEVLVAESGMEAIKLVYENMPALVLSDVIMPNINGYHLCRLIKRDKLTANIPVILFTVLDKKIDKFWGLRAGADDFFQKDGPDELLFEKIDSYLNASRLNQSADIRIDNTESYDFSAKVADILDESLVKSTLINEFRELGEFVLDEKTLNNKTFDLLSSILDYNLVGIFYNDSDKKDKIIFFNQNECDVSADVIKSVISEIQKNIKLNNPNNIIDFDYKIVSNGYDDEAAGIENINEFQSSFIYPVENEGKLLGVISLFHKNPNKYIHSKILDIILSEMHLIMKVKWLYSETKLLSIIDPLTTLYNRRYFSQILETEFSRSKRYTTPLSLAMVDIDNFKKLNDTYGHLFGDEVLQVISEYFKDSLRKTDYVARYGGEELVAILPETSIEQAFIPLERFRTKIAEHEFISNGNIVHVSVSIGIAQNDFTLSNSDNFIKKADDALYKAKETGKNKIEMAIDAE